MKPTTSRLIKMITMPKSFGQPPTVNEINKEKEEFFKRLLGALDSQLVGKTFFCGNEITVADLLYYNEISTVIHLTKKDLK